MVTLRLLKQNYRIIFFFFLLSIIFFLQMVPVLAVSSSSENYQVTNQIDFGGGTANSENYQITDQIDFGGGTVNSADHELFGFLTDESSIIFWPYYATTSIQPEPIEILKNPISNEGIIQIFPSDIPSAPFSDYEVALNNQLISGLTTKDLAIGSNISLTSAIIGLSMMVIILTQLINLGLVAPLANLWAWFLSIFSVGKKKGHYGVVYDAETRQPVPLVVVQIFDKEYNKLLATQTTDNEGRYTFIIKPGRYYLKAIKSSYIFPSKINTSGYHGVDFIVNQDSAVNFEIFLDPNVEILAKRINILSIMIKYLNVVRLPLLIIGTIVATVVYIQDRVPLNLIILIIYLAIWVIELYRLRQLRPYGITLEKLTMKHLNMVILRLFNEENKIISTKVSDANGRFTFLTNPGNYYLTALKPDFLPYKSQLLNFSKGGSINANVYLEKQNSHLNTVQKSYS